MFGDDDVMRQVQAWQRDSLLRELRSTYRQEQTSDPISGTGSVRPLADSNSVEQATRALMNTVVSVDK